VETSPIILDRPKKNLKKKNKKNLRIFKKSGNVLLRDLHRMLSKRRADQAGLAVIYVGAKMKSSIAIMIVLIIP
jgi:hypothetical protein